jgi:hypothetical protein
VSDDICSLRPRQTHLPPQTLFEEKLLMLLQAERARTLYYREAIRGAGPITPFEYLPGEDRDRYYRDAIELLNASL